MKKWQPMFMDPEFKETVWGGTRLLGIFAKKIPSAHTGESWEVSAHENGQSKIKNGFLEGKTLLEAVSEYPTEILGYTGARETGGKFPLLIKLIDASDDLSIQVHPNNEQALLLEGPTGRGKTEMWYIVDAEPDAQLIYGLKKDMTPSAFQEAIETGALEDYVNYVPVKKGDTFFIPAGTLHAIGAGIVLAEIQQSSDTTYRVYDYGRVGLDGNPRQLHVEKALQVTNLTSSKGNEYSNIDEGVVCDYFQVYRRNLRGIQEIAVSLDHFQIVLILEGSGKIDGMPFKKGDAILLPAAGETVGLEGRAVYLQIL
ncbi:MAG: class I mannose-6-phosphate isomerase [Firmicutes bacterium]|nr:class I mannose-6-phosphate isomerase [Bacillota bacterium]